MGFDACTQLNGLLFIFQFKASSKTLVRTGERQFTAQHQQMVNLKNICRNRRAVYYAFPLTGTSYELSDNPDLLDQTWMLDVKELPDPIPEPLKKQGSIRTSGLHYINVRPGNARVCSAPFNVPVDKASTVFSEIADTVSSANALEKKELGIKPQELMHSRIAPRMFGPNALGAILIR